jgi:hypothetical protein
MSAGFYKRRRGILEHIEAGTIDLLEDGIHDYLSLKANLVIGNGFPIPAGVVSTSAPALLACCKGVSVRTIQRRLNHLEKIGWLKFSPWRIPGKRGNYMVVICRASVHDLSGTECRVNGERTTDWGQPVYEPVGEVSVNYAQNVGEVSGYREVEKQRGEKRRPAAKPTPPADSRFQSFFSLAYEVYRARNGQPPTWGGKDKKILKQFLAEQPHITLEEWERRYRNYLDSTDRFIRSQGGSLAYFANHFDSFANGPIFEKVPIGGFSGKGIRNNSAAVQADTGKYDQVRVHRLENNGKLPLV